MALVREWGKFWYKRMHMSKDQPSQRLSATGDNRAGLRHGQPDARHGQPEEPQFGALLMTEGGTPRSGPPPMFRGLTEPEKARVLGSGKRKVLYRGAQLFSQGSPQDGIYLIESGRIKVFYIAPSGREITLAYWHSGNFVGGPEVFRQGLHVWSGSAAVNSTVLHLPGDVLRQMVLTIPALAINVIEGLSFKGQCYSALAQMLGTRSPTERLAQLLLHLMNLYGVEERDGTLIAASFTHADLAHMTGVTRQSVTISLKRFAEHGILHAHGTNLVITDVELLSRIRDGKPTKVSSQNES
jgi:CRP/FNR family transcriptional regulator, cyclic AMP receptor protein